MAVLSKPLPFAPSRTTITSHIGECQQNKGASCEQDRQTVDWSFGAWRVGFSGYAILWWDDSQRRPIHSCLWRGFSD